MKSNELNGARTFAVMVGEGSGCFFQPIGADYSYILTLKHNLKDKPQETVIILPSIINNGKDRQIKITQVYKHRDNNTDAAIIQVEKRDGIAHLCAMKHDEVTELEGFWVIGFPKTRREIKGEDPYREDELKRLGTKNTKKIEFCLVDIFDRPSMLGMSGGGIIMPTSENRYSIIAVQKQMAVKNGKESGKRVLAIPVYIFEEIIKENNLISLYLESEKTEDEVIGKIKDKINAPYWEPMDCDEVLELLTKMDKMLKEKEIRLANASEITSKAVVISQFKEMIESYRREATSDKKIPNKMLVVADKFRLFF